MKYFLLIFVEGDVEDTFYNLVIRFLREKYKTSNKIIDKIKKPTKGGYGQFKTKVVNTAKNEIQRIANKEKLDEIFIFLALDKDVFELAPKPPFDIKDTEKHLKQTLKPYNPNINIIWAEKMIEDVFLSDLEGVCNYLKLDIKNCKLKGRNGYEKLKNLFKKANKSYLKGKTKDFISFLNIENILQKNEKMFLQLIKVFE